MSLAARFPIRSSSNIVPSSYENEKPILVEEPELSILGTDDTFRQHEKIMQQPVYHQIPHVLQEPLDQKNKDLKSGSERRTSLVKADDKTQEEVVSAAKSVHTFIQHVNGELRLVSLSREEAEEKGIFLKPEQTFSSVQRDHVPPKIFGIIHDLHRPEYERPQLNENEEHNHTPIFYRVDSHQGNFKVSNQQPSSNSQHEMIKDFNWMNTFSTSSANAEKVDARGIGNMQEEAFDTRTSTVKNNAELPNKKSEQNTNVQNHSLDEAAKENTTTTLNARKGKTEDGKKSEIDWDELRKRVHCNIKRDRTADRMDSLDYEAVRCVDVKQISDTIKERGMNNMLAERMKAFLNRLVEDHGSIDLEWLRDAPPVPFLAGFLHEK